MMNLTGAFAIFCAVLCACCASCVAYTYKDCGSRLGNFTNVSVTDCQTTDDVCFLKRGKNVTMVIEFIPNVKVTEVFARAFGLFDVPKAFALRRTHVCLDSSSGVKCPLQKGRKYTYTVTIYVKRLYPPVSCNVNWQLMNEDRELIVCVEFPIRLLRKFELRD